MLDSSDISSLSSESDVDPASAVKASGSFEFAEEVAVADADAAAAGAADAFSVPLLSRLRVLMMLFNELLLLLDGRIDELIRRSRMSNAGDWVGVLLEVRELGRIGEVKEGGPLLEIVVDDGKE